MINKTNLSRIISLGAAAVLVVLGGGALSEANAQKDPFQKPGYAVPRKQPVAGSGSSKPVKPPPPAVVPMSAPPIEQRIEFYKVERERAVANDLPVPKVTSVLTLSEMSVTGIFRTPRGYAAMVEATPIKLSYAIYPGEKFFDGQLVAIEDNRLVFRKVMKMSNGKFVSSVENKALRQYSTQETVQGTAPVQHAGEKPVETATAIPVGPVTPDNRPVNTSMMSPLDEMDRQPAGQDEAGPVIKTKPARGGSAPKKPAAKVASKPKVTRE